MWVLHVMHMQHELHVCMCIQYLSSALCVSCSQFSVISICFSSISSWLVGCSAISRSASWSSCYGETICDNSLATGKDWLSSRVCTCTQTYSTCLCTCIRTYRGRGRGISPTVFLCNTNAGSRLYEGLRGVNGSPT